MRSPEKILTDLNFNCRVVLKKLLFFPYDLTEENTSVTIDDNKSLSIDSLLEVCEDGKSKTISKCKNAKNNCQLRAHFVPADKVVSTTTKRVYNVIIAPGEKNINCHYPNVIYLLTCNNCATQYVGETVCPISESFSNHNNVIHDLAKGITCGCKKLPEHFNTGLCKGSKYTVRILEKLEGNGRIGPGARDPIDQTSKRIRRAREKHWMLKLRTVFPFGLNDKVDGEWIRRSDDATPVSTKFPKLCRSERVSRGNKLNQNRTLDSFLDSLKVILDDRFKDAMNYLHVLLFSARKSVLKSIHSALVKKLDDRLDPYHQWYKAANDIIVSKIFKEPVVKRRKKIDPNNMVKLEFLNKGLEMINLSRLLPSPSLSKEFPSFVTKTTYLAPTVVYNLSSTIRSNIFNYKKFVDELDLTKFLKNPSILPCKCKESPFIDNFHGHIVGGDLDIIQNPELKSLFLKGPQYREPKTIDLDAANKEIRSGIEILINKWSAKYSVDAKHFDCWKYASF